MSEIDDVIEEMVPDVAKILAFLEDQRSKGRYTSLSAPDAGALVAGYDAVFLAEAHASAARSAEGRSRGNAQAEAGGAASAILCAVAACEGYVSEYLARAEFGNGPLPDALAAIRRDPDAAQQWKALFRILAPAFDFGTSNAYRALGCLFQIRGLVAHRNARTLPLGSFPEKLSDCVRTRIVPVEALKNADWTSVVFAAPVAEWAASTVSAWLGLAKEALPPAEEAYRHLTRT